MVNNLGEGVNVNMSSEKVIKKMANLLRAGATLLSYSCPICKSPLFRLKSGEVICPKCGKRVFIVKDEMEERKVYLGLMLKNLEETILSKVNEINLIISKRNVDEIDDYVKLLIDLLEVLERVTKLSERIR